MIKNENLSKLKVTIIDHKAQYTKDKRVECERFWER
jgi:hypothetical protein